MYSAGGMGSSYINIDAHTFIHEFGHAMGLNDYYNYDQSSSVAAAGGFDMQDMNVGDHNPFSKMSFNWSKPYVVTGNAEISIKSASKYKDQYIVIPAGGYDSWNKSPFDEYIVLEFYTADGMNEFDSTHQTYSGYPKGPTTSGVRAYHIDSRLYTFNKSTGDPYTSKGYTDSISNTTYTYDVAATNTTSGSSYVTDVTEAVDYRQVHLLSASGSDRSTLGYTLTSSDLFTANKSFSMSSFSEYFSHNGYMNEKASGGSYNEQLGFSFTVTSITSDYATIRITTTNN